MYCSMAELQFFSKKALLPAVLQSSASPGSLQGREHMELCILPVPMRHTE